MRISRHILLLCAFVALQQEASAQRFHLFSDEIKRDFPSVVYDFLERYLYETDSLQLKGVDVTQKLHDDKVMFMAGSASTARKISPFTPFSMKNVESKYYQVGWTDTNGKALLTMAFPMQYELLWGKPKVQLEQTLKDEIAGAKEFVVVKPKQGDMEVQTDSCLMSKPVENYYVKSLNTATYFRKQGNQLQPVFDSSDKWHSAANLFLGCIAQADLYNIYVKQNVYGFKKIPYTMKLSQWLAYCQAMKLKMFFTVEEEREDGLKALLIAQSDDLKFNHMLSIVIPDDFVTNPKAMLKATLNAYIPTQNVKNLYQQYVKKSKKRI